MKMMVEYLLRRSGSADGVLQMVDSAINFAAKQHPRDFLKIRSQIKKKLNNALLSVGSEGSSNGYNPMTDTTDCRDINMADTVSTCESCNVKNKKEEFSSFEIQQDKNTVVESNGDDKKKGPFVIRFKLSAAMKKEQLASENNKVSSLRIQQDKNAAVEPEGDDKKKGPLVVRFKLPPAKKPRRC